MLDGRPTCLPGDTSNGNFPSVGGAGDMGDASEGAGDLWLSGSGDINDESEGSGDSWLGGGAGVSAACNAAGEAGLCCGAA